MIEVFYMLAILGTMIAPSSRYQPTNPTDNVYLEPVLEIHDPSEWASNPSFVAIEAGDRTEQTFTAELNRLYVPFSLTVNFNVNGYQINSFRAYVFDTTNNGFQGLNLRGAYGFMFYEGNTDLIMQERNAKLISQSSATMEHVIMNSFSSYSQTYGSNLTDLYIRTDFSNFVNHAEITLDTNEFLNIAEPYYWNAVERCGVPKNWYDVIYNNGKDDGYEIGKSAGYAEGKQDGLEEADNAQGILATLFGGIVSVPLDILNGMSPLVIWEVPIISIIFTFLVVALLLWIIRKFI